MYWKVTQLRKELLAKDPENPALKQFYNHTYFEINAYEKALSSIEPKDTSKGEN